MLNQQILIILKVQVVRKDPVKFYHHCTGILVASYPCQFIHIIEELYNSESITQVYCHIHSHLEKNFNTDIYDPKNFTIVYNDACHLKRFCIKCGHLNEINNYLSTAEIFCDILHFGNHIDTWCIQNCNPSQCESLIDVNTETCKHIFSWMSRYSYMTRYMNRNHFFY